MFPCFIKKRRQIKFCWKSNSFKSFQKHLKFLYYFALAAFSGLILVKRFYKIRAKRNNWERGWQRPHASAKICFDFRGLIEVY
jgi:hypothetical protein